MVEAARDGRIDAALHGESASHGSCLRLQRAGEGGSSQCMRLLVWPQRVGVEQVWDCQYFYMPHNELVNELIYYE